MQKVYSEAVGNTRHDVWDIHTNKDRWWVITGAPTSTLRSSPSMDLALTFHIWPDHPIPRTEEQRKDDLRILPFGSVFEKVEEAGTAVTQAQSLTDYQAVGVRCREALLELIGRRAGRGNVDRQTATACEFPRVGGNHLQRSSAGRH